MKRLRKGPNKECGDRYWDIEKSLIAITFFVSVGLAYLLEDITIICVIGVFSRQLEPFLVDFI